MQGDARTKSEGGPLECAVEGGKVLGAATGEIVEIFFVGGSEQSFAPGEEGLGIETDGALVEFRFVVEVAPAAFRGGGDFRGRSEGGLFYRHQ